MRKYHPRQYRGPAKVECPAHADTPHQPRSIAPARIADSASDFSVHCDGGVAAPSAAQPVRHGRCALHAGQRAQTIEQRGMKANCLGISIDVSLRLYAENQQSVRAHTQIARLQIAQRLEQQARRNQQDQTERHLKCKQQSAAGNRLRSVFAVAAELFIVIATGTPVALRNGARPKMSAASTLTARVNSNTLRSSETGNRIPDQSTSARAANTAKIQPSAAPIPTSRRLSVSSWRKSVTRPAPRAMRTPNSRCRASYAPAAAWQRWSTR